MSVGFVAGPSHLLSQGFACIDKGFASVCCAVSRHAISGKARHQTSPRPRRPPGIMSGGSDDVSPPTAEPLLFEILRTIETAKEMPDDCPMHLQDFFALVSAHASLTPSLLNCLRMAAARSLCVSSCVHRALWTLQVHGRACPSTACASTPQHAAPRKMLRAARPVPRALITSTPGSHSSKFNALTASPIRPTHRSAVSYMAKRATQAPRCGSPSSSPRRS